MCYNADNDKFGTKEKTLIQQHSYMHYSFPAPAPQLRGTCHTGQLNMLCLIQVTPVQG